MVVGEAFFVFTDEVDFSAGELADENFISTAKELQVNDIFQNMTGIASGVIHEEPAEGGVYQVVLGIGLQDFLASHIEAVGLVEKQAVRKAADIALYGLVVRFASAAGEGVGDFGGRDETSHIGGDVFHNAFQDRRIPGAQTSQGIFDEDGIVNAGEIFLHIFLFALDGKGEGKGAVFHIGGVLGGQAVVAFRKAGHVLFEGKGQHVKLYVAAGEQRGQLAGKEIGIRPGEVEVYIFADVEAVHHLFKLRHLLDFVKENIIFSLWRHMA